MGRVNTNFVLDDEESRETDRHYVYRSPRSRGQPATGLIYVLRTEMGRVPPETVVVRLEWPDA